MSELLLLLFKKKLWAICSCPSWQKSDGSELLSLLLKKSDRSDSLVIPVNCSPKREICSTKLIFFLCFWQFFTAFPLFMPRRELLFTKERLWANRSHPSLQKSDHERFAQVAQCSWQKSDGKDFFFTSKSLFRSQKTSNSLKKLMSKFPTLPLLWNKDGLYFSVKS